MASPQAASDTADVANEQRPARAINACRRCRERKVKCSGTQPCMACVTRNEDCIIEPEDKKIVVSERYLAELKRKLESQESGAQVTPQRPNKRRQGPTPGSMPGPRLRASLGTDETPNALPTQSSRDSSGSPEVLLSPPRRRSTQEASATALDPAEVQNRQHGEITNPLSCGPSEFITDNRGRKRFLGPSSTWAYSQQVLIMMRQHLGHADCHEVPPNLDGGAFSIDWPSEKVSGPLRVGRLPSLDFALYLINTVKFRLGQMYHLFDEQSFMLRLHSFYVEGSNQEPAPESRLWYIQYLLLMAFGQALLSGLAGKTPPDADLVSRAIELLPDTFGLYREPILSIEVLCGLAFYLQCIDHRNSAYTYIGMALRMALSQGLHREMTSDNSMTPESQRRRSVWWTTYILDRKFSSLMGAPNSVQDEEITVPLPHSGHSERIAEALKVHVNVSRLLARVLSSVYGTEEKLGHSFVKNVRTVLRDMADLADDLEGAFEFKFDDSAPISRVAATLNLYYHQCIVLATRPLFVCLLKDVVASRQEGQANKSNDISKSLKALLQASRDSASKSLRILVGLQSQRLLDKFLPFDLESTFSCAFVLSLMAAIPSLPPPDPQYIATSFSLLDDMIAGGNITAQYRKDELQELRSLLELLRVDAASSYDTGAPRIASNPTRQNGDSANANTAQHIHQQQHNPLPLATNASTALHPANMNGLSPENMLYIAGVFDWSASLDFTSGDLLPAHWLGADGSADSPGSWTS